MDLESSRKFILDIALSKLELHKTRTDVAHAGYQKTRAAADAQKRDYEREEDQYNQAIAAYTYFQRVLDKPALDKGTSVVQVKAPPSHARTTSEVPQPSMVYYKSSSMSPRFSHMYRYSHGTFRTP